MYNGEWTEVLVYNDGCNDEGKLHPAKWIPLSEICMWKEEELELLVAQLTGKEETYRVIGRNVERHY